MSCPSPTDLPHGPSPANSTAGARPGDFANSAAETRDGVWRSRALQSCSEREGQDRQLFRNWLRAEEEMRPPRPLTHILAVSPDPELQDSRCSILSSAGYLVDQAISIDKAIGGFQAGDFDIVLLCHSIAIQDRDRLACLIRASGSIVPVVYVTAAAGQVAGRASDTLADASVESAPDRLLSGIRQALRKADKDGAGREMPSSDSSS